MGPLLTINTEMHNTTTDSTLINITSSDMEGMNSFIIREPGDSFIFTDEVHGPTSPQPSPQKDKFNFGAVSDVIKYGVPLHPYNRDLGPAMKQHELLWRNGMTQAAEKLHSRFSLEMKLQLLSQHKYLRITPEKIFKFLITKAQWYEKFHGAEEFKEERRVTNYIPDFSGEFITVNTSYRNDSKMIGQLQWEETPITNYTGIPPTNVLEKLEVHKAKNIFDYFTIAEVKEIPDPVLLGRITGCDDRFWITSWGEDIKLDDLI